jgi:2-keto-3-deoxy-L-rhamnonate aldolase RhmA
MKPLKSRLAEGQVTVGSWLTLAHPAIAEIMSRAGFDWLTIDLEHSVITIREAEEVIRIVELLGVVQRSSADQTSDGRRGTRCGRPYGELFCGC